jgi:peptidylprolyl isomerase
MTRSLLPFAALLALGSPVLAQEEPAAPSPAQIVEEAAREEWVAIAPEDLLVMTLAPAADGSTRAVVIQLMPAPYSQGWVANIRTLARAGWYDGITVNRVQDNYVVQWGDPNYDNPEAEGAAKPLPEGLVKTTERDYAFEHTLDPGQHSSFYPLSAVLRMNWVKELAAQGIIPDEAQIREAMSRQKGDSYTLETAFIEGWPVGMEAELEPQHRDIAWPVHCYGMVGVGRGYSPDTGSGAELYTVIGQAPRHLDRNIALVGRIVEGMEHLSSLPRGSGALGFYTAGEAGKRTPILSVRVASDLPGGEQPVFEYLSTDSETFARYADARANRRDPFFIHPAGGADICNIPVPVRRVAD